ncbi:MAG: hypothetical protein KGZ39_05730 [Simkania sp.]|nr:hypothetical protein [Simkania sp.]
MTDFGLGDKIVLEEELTSTLRHHGLIDPKTTYSRLNKQHWGVRPQMMPIFNPELDLVIDTPLEKLKFKDFMVLKVGGFDQFSNLKYDELVKRASAANLHSILEALTSRKAAATALRWTLRGLDAPKAIRKVQVDLEVSKNCYPK